MLAAIVLTAQSLGATLLLLFLPRDMELTPATRDIQTCSHSTWGETTTSGTRPVLGTGQAYCGYLFHFEWTGPWGFHNNKYSYIDVGSSSLGSYYLGYSESTGPFSLDLTFCGDRDAIVGTSYPNVSCACFNGVSYAYNCSRSWGTSGTARVQPYPEISEDWGEFPITGFTGSSAPQYCLKNNSIGSWIGIHIRPQMELGLYWVLGRRTVIYTFIVVFFILLSTSLKVVTALSLARWVAVHSLSVSLASNLNCVVCLFLSIMVVPSTQAVYLVLGLIVLPPVSLTGVRAMVPLLFLITPVFL